MISMIVASDENNVIGNKGKIPWHSPEDMNFFRTKTVNNTVVMGWKTFESLGGKPLKNRTNLVLTHELIGGGSNIPNTYFVSSVERAAMVFASFGQGELFVIGGASIYSQFFPFVTNLYLSKINRKHDGDTFFKCNLNGFKLIEEKEFDLGKRLIYKRDWT